MRYFFVFFLLFSAQGVFAYQPHSVVSYVQSPSGSSVPLLGLHMTVGFPGWGASCYGGPANAGVVLQIGPEALWDHNENAGNTVVVHRGGLVNDLVTFSPVVPVGTQVYRVLPVCMNSYHSWSYAMDTNTDPASYPNNVDASMAYPDNFYYASYVPFLTIAPALPIVVPPAPVVHTMSATSSVALITGTLADYGLRAVGILALVLSMGVAYLLFKFGWKLFNDRSVNIFGFYPKDLPYKGYKRFRSRTWNIKHSSDTIK